MIPAFAFIFQLFSNQKYRYDSELLRVLFNLGVLGCWAVFNPFQSPMLAHCSVQE